jgi:hypothetical protein
MSGESEDELRAELRRRQLRELDLVDRVLGLEGEVARLSIMNQDGRLIRDEIERLEGENRALRGSATWRAGRAVLAPWLIVRKVFRRGR